MSLTERIRDWWRGYTDDDIESAQRLLDEHHAPERGEWVPLTRGQFNAIRHENLWPKHGNMVALRWWEQRG